VRHAKVVGDVPTYLDRFPDAGRKAAGSARWPFLLHAILLLATAFALRKAQFGNPVIQVDEQFYLLVGDRLLHGALPFVDIWDCKPVGLFLLYAGIRLLGGSGIIQYQIVATLFAAATAIMIARIGQRIGGGFAALCGGIIYLLWINWFGGDGGQTPVFYNALVIGAALVVLQAWKPAGERDRRLMLGCLAMFLMGLGLQIKYSCVFEGAFFGLVLLHAGYRNGDPPMRLAFNGVLWIACALAPTAAAWAVYGVLGHGEAFAYANFISVFHQKSLPLADLRSGLWRIVGNTLVLTIPAMVGAWLWRPADDEGARIRAFIWGWFAAAWVGLLVYGAFYKNYALPAIVPTSLVLVPILSLPLLGPVLAMAAMLFGYVGSSRAISRNVQALGGKAEVDQLVDLIKPHLRSGCLYVYDGEPILYLLTRSCLPTPYAFPGHLHGSKLANALGIDSTAELRRVLRSQPSIIVTKRPYDNLSDASHNAIIDATLTRRYYLIGSVKVGHDRSMVFAPKEAVKAK
jgi:hypothetical protein